MPKVVNLLLWLSRKLKCKLWSGKLSAAEPIRSGSSLCLPPASGVRVDGGLTGLVVVCACWWTRGSPSSAWVGDWFLCTFYAPPRGQGDAQVQASNAIQQVFETHSVHSLTPWLCLGDANEVPGDSCIQSMLETYGGRVCAQGIPTRWQGTREIDWVATSCAGKISAPCNSQYYFFDHQAVWCEVQTKARDTVMGSLTKSADWRKPAGVGTDAWRTCLDKAWSEACWPIPEGTCQEKWDIFMLVKMFCLKFLANSTGTGLLITSTWLGPRLSPLGGPSDLGPVKAPRLVT